MWLIDRWGQVKESESAPRSVNKGEGKAKIKNNRFKQHVKHSDLESQKRANDVQQS